MQSSSFTLAQVADFIGEDAVKLRQWINRGLPAGKHDLEKGKHARFSFHTLIEFALASEASKSGLPLSACFSLAGGFAHGGNGETEKHAERLPAYPFRNGAAYAVYDQSWGDHDPLVIPSYDAIKSVPRHLGARPYQMHLLDAGAVFARVIAALGQDLSEVLIEAYGEDG